MLLAACSSSSSSSGAAAGAGTGGGTTSTTSAGTTGSSGGGGSVPDVANATNLQVAPAISAGTPPAPTSLVTKDLVVGSGATATPTSTVKVQYVGANYADGKVFDSSWSRGSAATFPLNQVIPGFAQGIVGMKVGGRRVIVIPSSLGYGAAGSPPAVGPNENLVFVVDLTALQ
jgi:peptidylprolyl isomerase